MGIEPCIIEHALSCHMVHAIHTTFVHKITGIEGLRKTELGTDITFLVKVKCMKGLSLYCTLQILRFLITHKRSVYIYQELIPLDN